MIHFYTPENVNKPKVNVNVRCSNIQNFKSQCFEDKNVTAENLVIWLIKCKISLPPNYGFLPLSLPLSDLGGVVKFPKNCWGADVLKNQHGKQKKGGVENTKILVEWDFLISILAFLTIIVIDSAFVF